VLPSQRQTRIIGFFPRLLLTSASSGILLSCNLRKLQLAERLSCHGLLIQLGLYLVYISGIVEMYGNQRQPIPDALAQKTRLDVVQLLLEYEPDGLSSGEVSAAEHDV
jgi:hypothetical protein